MKRKLFLALPLVFLTFSFAHAEPALKGCAAKKQAIETELDYARKHNNSHQIVGLEKALKEVAENCTDEKLRAERKAKISGKTGKGKTGVERGARRIEPLIRQVLFCVFSTRQG